MSTKFLHQPLHPKHMKLRTAGLASEESAKFGMVRRRPNGKPRAHQGIDLAVDNGYRCYAVDDGTVAFAADIPNGYGKQVCLALSSGLFAFYAHLSRIDVKQGQAVKAGDVIGLTGSTGNAAGMMNEAGGSHLHFEVRDRAQCGLGLAGRLDPLAFVTLTRDIEQPEA